MFDKSSSWGRGTSGLALSIGISSFVACGDDSATGQGGGGGTTSSASTTAVTTGTPATTSPASTTSTGQGGEGAQGGGGGGGGGGGAGDCVVDDLFCNGLERIVDGVCVKVPADPCDDGQPCTEDTCDEDLDRCGHELGEDCDACLVEACEPDCEGKACGDDGCGGLCGECLDGEGCASVAGTCEDANQPGTCGDPYALDLVAGTTVVIDGDSSTGLHQATPTCNSTSTAVEDIYVFTLAEQMGIDARSYGYDTVLHIRSACEDDTPAATIGCADDSSPPGDYGSRVAVLLDPGTYYLIVDGFDSTQFGPYELSVRAEQACVPQCDGVYCGGDDACGGDCGTCDVGFACADDFRCRPDPCLPDCTNDDDSPRVCGDNGCQGSCGTCEGGSLCVDSAGQCEVFPTCDHFDPTCEGCAADEFCGSDCACHAVTDPLPDLILSAERLADEILFDVGTFDENSCAVAEGCVDGLGERRLLRFSVEAINQGQVTLEVPPPADRPDLFQYSPCHGHYHFDGFAEYALLDGDGEVVVPGRKQAYCMEDTAQVLLGPGIGCNKVYSCEEQGIQPGWSDLYGNGLDCQWLDITDVAPGDYQITVTVNPNRAFEEMTFDNNTATVPVTILPR